jgi:hypothetical protein
MKIQIWTIVFFVFCLSGCSYVQHEKPNVVIIMTDDQGYGDMSCNGHPVLNTANIDKTQDVNPDETAVTFQVTLPKGDADLQTWFIDKDGTKRTAYWVYVTKGVG